MEKIIPLQRIKVLANLATYAKISLMRGAQIWKSRKAKGKRY